VTVTVALATAEGVVLGSDSTTTVGFSTPAGLQVGQLYNSAQKIFEIGPANCDFKSGCSFSAGLAMWGDGAFGPLSWRAVINEFWAREISPRTDPIADLSRMFLAFLQGKWAELQQGQQIPQNLPIPDTGFALAAIHKNTFEVHAAQIDLRAATVDSLQRSDIRVGGDPTTFYRLVSGFDNRILAELPKNGIDPAAFQRTVQQFSIEPYLAQMPLRDAIDFVHFMVYSSIKMHRYKGGPATVGGPIEIAAITADRGFRWVLHKPLYESIGIPRGDHTP